MVAAADQLVLEVSIHAPRAGRDNMRLPRLSCGYGFNPRAPRGARPIILLSLFSVRNVSIHAPRAGRDRVPIARFPWGGCFNPRAPRGARLALTACRIHPRLVSIHAPRAGRDMRKKFLVIGWNVSIHAPRAGRDLDPVVRALISHTFQSTRPARGATPRRLGLASRSRVSIHAPRAGRDWRRSVRCGQEHVSIHAPRAGRDEGKQGCRAAEVGFNPRAPRGARRLADCRIVQGRGFQSTRPARGATQGHTARV